MATLRLLRQDDFTGGINLRADPFQLAETESPDLMNVDIDPRGGFAMRLGVQRAHTSAIGSLAAGALNPYKLFSWETSTPQLLAASNAKVYYSTGGNFTDTTIPIAGIDGAGFAPWATGSSAFVYVATGGGTNVYKWSGSAATSLTASGTGQWQESLATPTGTHAPRCEHVASHAGRLWVANTTENATNYPNRIRFSHPNFPESWRSADYIDIPEGGSGITALVPFGEALLVFKRSSITAIYGYDTDTFQVVNLTNKLGVMSSRQLVATENYLYFLSWPDGVFAWDGKGFKDLFESIRPLIQTGGLSESNLPTKSWVSFVNSKLLVSLPLTGATTASVTYVFDPTIGAWTRYQLADGKGIGPAVDFVASTGVKSYLALHPTQPWMLRIDVPGLLQDDINGTPATFASHYTTRWNDGGVVSAKKMWRRPDFVVKQPSTDLTLKVEVFHNWEEANVRRLQSLTIDGQAGGLTWNAIGAEPDGIPGWGEAPWGAGAAGAQHERGSNLGLARAVQLRITGPGARAWGVNSITYKYQQRKIR